MKTFVTVLLLFIFYKLFKHLNIILFRITKTYHHNEVYTVSNITFQSLILIKFKLLKELYPRAVAGEGLRSSSDRSLYNIFISTQKCFKLKVISLGQR